VAQHLRTSLQVFINPMVSDQSFKYVWCLVYAMSASSIILWIRDMCVPVLMTYHQTCPIEKHIRLHLYLIMREYSLTCLLICCSNQKNVSEKIIFIFDLPSIQSLICGGECHFSLQSFFTMLFTDTKCNCVCSYSSMVAMGVKIMDKRFTLTVARKRRRGN